jgi:hypothetical protein
MIFRFLPIFLLAAFFVLPAFATDVQTDTAILGGLDKVSGQVNTFKVPVGAVVEFGKLQIIVRTCVTHPPEERPENAAFLEISQTFPKEKPKPVFSGWMFASTPAISAMDNPVYDVWVIRCENRASSKSP